MSSSTAETFIATLALGNFHCSFGRLIYNKFWTGLRNERLNTTNGQQNGRTDRQRNRQTDRTYI